MRSEEFGLRYSRSPIFVGCPFKEPRVICGTRGDPDTVAPFRAWRGSRDLVAQSPKLHERAVAKSEKRECEFSLTQRCEGNGNGAVIGVLIFWIVVRDYWCGFRCHFAKRCT